MKKDVEKDIEDYAKFVVSFDGLWKKKNDQMGLILKCHLVLECYMTECLKTSYPQVDDIEAARLSFFQIYNLLPVYLFGFPWIKRGVGELNTLRNKVAHNIDYEIKEKDLEKIHKCMDIFYEVQKKKKKRGNDAIKDFTKLAAMALFGHTTKIKREAPITGVAGYQSGFEKRALEAMEKVQEKSDK
jgi:hypothetical protein